MIIENSNNSNCTEINYYLFVGQNNNKFFKRNSTTIFTKGSRDTLELPSTKFIVNKLRNSKLEARR